MKQLTIFLFAVSIALFTACTNDDDAPTTTPEENVSQHVVSIDYTNSRYKDKDIFEYDKQGRIVHFELNDSNESYLSGFSGKTYRKKVLDDFKTADYKYDLENGRIYIEYVEELSNLRDYYPKAPSTDRHYFDTIFVSNNRIDSIHGKRPWIQIDYEMEGLFTKSYFKYSDDNELISYKAIERVTSTKTLVYDDTYTWKDGNIISRQVAECPEWYHDDVWTYSDKKGYFPTYNVFTIIFGLRYGLLAEQGLFGKLPENLIATHTPHSDYDETDLEDGYNDGNNTFGPRILKYDFEYSFTGDKISAVNITATKKFNGETYTTPYRNMAITWR